MPPATTRAAVEDADPFSRQVLVKLIRVELGFDSDDATHAIDEYVAGARAGRDRERALRRLEQRLYSDRIRALCVQSAHVTLARAVLYRVLEDRDLASTRVSGPALAEALEGAQRPFGGSPTPALQLLERMREASEAFLPSLYQRRELDWWLVAFPRSERQDGLFDQRLGPVEVELMRMLRVLDSYDFSAIEQDVWRDIYEHHLPSEERQRLGSFYTPDVLVRLALDLADWRAGRPEVADAFLADISCGSGAFLVEALRRRRSALQVAKRLPSHPSPDQLDHLVGGIVGLDIHPFATFLASVNLLFQVIDLYESVRRRHSSYTLPLNVFTVDALEDAGVHPRQARLQDDLPEDIRVRHTEAEIERYQQLRARRFDTIVGNPPWGGILKGRLSPLNDPDKRREYANGRFDSATGKYDIFVLFVERSIRWLRSEGRYSFVVPSAYRDKDFGRGLREFLAHHAMPSTIVDVPFGPLLFRAANTPSLLAGSRAEHANGEIRVVALHRRFAFTAPPRDRERRHAEVAAAIESTLAGQAIAGVSSYREPAASIARWAGHAWPLHPKRHLRNAVEHSGEHGIDALLSVDQGVTPGGEGVLAILQMPPERSLELRLESELVHPAVKGLDLLAGAAPMPPAVQLYPYLTTRDGTRRAFDVAPGTPRVWDALDPDPHDQSERVLVAGLGERDRHRRLLERRIAEGRCPYPAAASYLLEHYDLLASRRPKDKPITSYGRRWWEYLWHRDASVMLRTTKIIGPRLTRWPRFALDEHGTLPTDSCVVLVVPTEQAARRTLARLKKTLTATLKRDVGSRDVLLYALAFLNATPSAAMLRIGRLPTPRGSWAVEDDYLGRVRFALPDDQGLITAIWKRAGDLVTTTASGQAAGEILTELDDLVGRALGLSEETKRELAAWAREEHEDEDQELRRRPPAQVEPAGSAAKNPQDARKQGAQPERERA